MHPVIPGPAGAVPFQLDVHGGSLQISPLLAFGGGFRAPHHGAKMCERQLFAGTYIGKTKYNTEGFFLIGKRPKILKARSGAYLQSHNNLSGHHPCPNCAMVKPPGSPPIFLEKKDGFPFRK